MNDEAVAEVIEEEVAEITEPVDTDEEWLLKRNEEIAAKDDDDDDDDEPEITASEDEVKPEEKAEPSESSTENKDDGFQKRIDELTRQYYTEKQQREMFQQQLEDSKQAEIPIEPGKTLADFEYDEGKFAQYVQGQAVAEAKAEIERSKQQEAAAALRADFSAKEAKFAADVPDYYQVAHYSPISTEVARAVQSAEKAPELAYYLGKHPEIATSLSNMHPLDAARELGRIEATKLVKPEPPPKPKPAAAPKIKAANTSNERVKPDTARGDELSDAEWLKRRNKQLYTR